MRSHDKAVPLELSSRVYEAETDEDEPFDLIDWGVCRLLYGPLTKRPAGALAVPYDGEEHVAGLVTSPDFGCVQWEVSNDHAQP